MIANDGGIVDSGMEKKKRDGLPMFERWQKCFVCYRSWVLFLNLCS